MDACEGPNNQIDKATKLPYEAPRIVKLYGERKMMCFKDKTFCASPECKNECKTKFTREVEEAAKRVNLPVSIGYFCGLPKWLKEFKDNQGE